MYRLFGYYGGPLALEALYAGIGPDNLPRDSDRIDAWFDEVVSSIVRAGSQTAVKVLVTNRDEIIQHLKNAIPDPRPRVARVSASTHLG